MKLNHFAAMGAVAGALVLAGAAEAAVGTATGSVNMRTGPGTGYAKITTIPAGAQVEVLGCPSWCQVVFAGQQGWASSNYIATGYADYSPAPVYQQPTVVYQQPAIVYERPIVSYGFYDRPYRRWDYRDRWDGHYGYWRDRDDWWWRRHRGPGVSFEFGFND
jgi:uncharacterized protein YraI